MVASPKVAQRPQARRIMCLAALCAALSACATPQSDDPLAPINRGVHAFNKGVDSVVLRPTSQVYGTVLPAPIRRGVDNMAANLGEPATIVNQVLQAQLVPALGSGLRFVINSTIGVAGLFDAAGAMGLERQTADFGQTLAVWGVGEGVYVELPLAGPSTARDALGFAVDIALNPVSHLTGSQEVLSAARRVRVADLVGDRYALTGVIDSVLYESADSYAQSRLLYLQNRRFRLNGGAVDATSSVEGDPYADPYFDPYAQ